MNLRFFTPYFTRANTKTNLIKEQTDEVHIAKLNVIPITILNMQLNYLTKYSVCRRYLFHCL